MSDCSTYLELFNYKIAPMKHGSSLDLTPGLIFLFWRTLNSRIYIFLWKCPPDRGSWTRWHWEAPSDQHFYRCLIKDTAVNDLQPRKFVTFDRNKDSNRCCICSFQKEESFERKMRPRCGNVRSSNGSTLTHLSVSAYSALVELANEFNYLSCEILYNINNISSWLLWG